ncbi:MULTISPECIES: hypothetical protein [Pontibacillus]|uniref:MFS transporter n=1 Tax=Pontibacillus chungwhensis TaxID=265426 RepID=A0ABY8V274_9BACI|nr:MULTISPECIES: hypothetical protein [Pontibacillus]MCD5322260.1 hypothetical protein [Pontibacillus sp. HN14]WIF99553.1 hypothetical protein QNI29_07815 [Pontibacillus chungwhensis]
MWNHLSKGNKLILLASAMAILSLFFTWVDLGILSANGFQQQGYILLVFFIYPVYQALKGNKIGRMAGYISAVGGIVSIVAFMMSKTGNILGQQVNLASTGMYIFLIAAILLTVGIYLSRKEDASASYTDASPLSK